jgi:hypothetical protein
MNSRSLILFLTVISVWSCRPKKEIVSVDDILKKPDEVIDAVKKEDIENKIVSLKANVQMNNGKQKISFKANIKIVRDSVIWTNITYYGIAGAKALLSEDSIKIINYKDNNYILEDYEKFRDWLNTDMLTLGNLQKVMLGDFVEVESDIKYRLTYEDDSYLLSNISKRKIEKDWMEKKIEKMEKRIEKTEEKNDDKRLEKLEKKQDRRPKIYEGLAVESFIDPKSHKTSKLVIRDYYNGGSLMATYHNFKAIGEKKIPHEVNLILASNNEIKLKIEYYKVSIDKEVSIPFSIPSKYERTNL